MFEFGDPLTLQNVLRLVSPYQIFKYYLPELNVGKVTNSPFRKDSRPSFGLFLAKDSDEVLYNDLGYSDSGNWIKFLMKLFNIGFKDVLRLVNRDMNLGLMDYSNSTLNVKETKSKIVKNINNEVFNYDLTLNVRKRPWNYNDIAFWGQFCLTIDELGEDVYPISAYWLNDWTTVQAEKFAYGYDFYMDGEILRRKIYQPYSKDNKWKTNLNTLVIDGIKDIPKKGDLLIITKARKDRLVLKHFGYVAIATNNEGSWIPEVNYNKLKSRFKRILIFFDNDEAGIKAAEKFSKKYDIEYIIVPTNSEIPSHITDISDVCKYKGENFTKLLLNNIINNGIKA